MKKFLIVIGAIILLGGVVYVAGIGNPSRIEPVATNTSLKEAPIESIEGTRCYAYHQEATKDAPYKVDEYINMTIAGSVVTGTKSGTQSGPDMTNGYIGTLKGSLNDDIIDLIFAYTIEGSQNNEEEIYKIVPTGLNKLRYQLKEEGGILVPDMAGEPRIISYNKADCK